jgi:hypothetical protein
VAIWLHACVRTVKGTKVDQQIKRGFLRHPAGEKMIKISLIAYKIGLE